MPFEVYRGDNKTLRVSIVDSCGDPVDTTGWIIEFTLRVSADAAASLVTKTSATPGEIDAVIADEGIWDINLLPADTQQVPGTYVFDVQGTTADVTPKIYTVIKDTLTINQDVTY